MALEFELAEECLDPRRIASVIQLAVDASSDEAEEFLARPSREQAIEWAVFGSWQSATNVTAENRRLAMLGAREGLRQYLYEQALADLVRGGLAGRLQ